jgi:hypothetical protein
MHNAQCTMHNAQCTMSWYRASVVQIRAMNVHKFIAHRPVAHCTTATAHCTTATFQATAGFTLVAAHEGVAIHTQSRADGSYCDRQYWAREAGPAGY